MFKKIIHGLKYIVAFSSMQDYISSGYNVINYDKLHRAVLWYVAYRFKKENPMHKAIVKSGIKLIRKVY